MLWPCGHHVDTTEEAPNPHNKAAHAESLHSLFLLHSQTALSLSVVLLTRRYSVKSMSDEPCSQSSSWVVWHFTQQSVKGCFPSAPGLVFAALITRACVYVWVKSPILAFLATPDTVSAQSKHHTPSAWLCFLAVGIICTRWLADCWPNQNNCITLRDTIQSGR